MKKLVLFNCNTKVIFRKFPGGDVIALFPEIAGSMNPGTMQSYMHVGQHGAADCVDLTKPATPAEYADLKKELEGLGHVLVVAKRCTRKDFDKRVEELRNG